MCVLLVSVLICKYVSFITCAFIYPYLLSYVCCDDILYTWQVRNDFNKDVYIYIYIWRCQSSMEFHGIFHVIPRNPCVIWYDALLIPLNPTELGDFLFGDSIVPSNSMEYSREVQGTNVELNNLKNPWNSMELNDISFWWHQSYIEFHGIFHGIPWNTCVIWNDALLIPLNPTELGDFLFVDSRVPWNSMEYPMEVQGNMILNKMTISKFHGIPWN